jgi:hypothetical protein
LLVKSKLLQNMLQLGTRHAAVAYFAQQNEVIGLQPIG